MMTDDAIFFKGCVRWCLPSNAIVFCFFAKRRGRYVTVDLGSEYVVTSVTLWHYYADVRQYCSQSLLLSTTGAFAGEEVQVYSTGTGYGPVETAEGHTINFNATTARCVSSKSSSPAHVLLLPIDPHRPVSAALRVP